MNFGTENDCHVLLISKPWPIDQFTLRSNGNIVTQLSDRSRSGPHKKWLAERGDFTPQRTDVNLIWSAMTFPHMNNRLLANKDLEQTCVKGIYISLFYSVSRIWSRCVECVGIVYILTHVKDHFKVTVMCVYI